MLAAIVTGLVTFVVAAAVAGKSGVNVGLARPFSGVIEPNVVDRHPVYQAVGVEDFGFGDDGCGCLSRGGAHCHGKLEALVIVVPQSFPNSPSDMQSDSSDSAFDSLSAEIGSPPFTAAAAPPAPSSGERFSTGSNCMTVSRKPHDPLTNCEDCELPIFCDSSSSLPIDSRQ